LVEECSPAGFEAQIFAREMIATFIFVTVILCIKKYSPSPDGLVNCGAIAMTLYGMIKMIGGLTGGCMNPAVAITQEIFQHMIYADMTAESLWIYIMAPLMGGLLAGAFVYAKLYSEMPASEADTDLDAPEKENLVSKTGKQQDSIQNV